MLTICSNFVLGYISFSVCVCVCVLALARKLTTPWRKVERNGKRGKRGVFFDFFFNTGYWKMRIRMGWERGKRNKSNICRVWVDVNGVYDTLLLAIYMF
jgi:hypothetical protein